jgi:phosphatidylglycerophosphate synthase
MSSTSAVVFDGGPSITLGGLTLTERAVLLAHRAGLRPVRVWGAAPPDAASTARLAARGVTIVPLPATAAPLKDAADTEGVVVIGLNVLFAPKVLTDLVAPEMDASTTGVAAVDASGSPRILYVPPGSIDTRACTSLDAMTASLPAVVRLAPPAIFCEGLDRPDAVHAVERAYTRYMNGGASESYFTKKIRRFSVPLTGLLVRLGARPTHVTLGGLALAIASAWCLAQGRYAFGLLGGILYYASMVFDCSDGEVARLTVRDGRLGAWLETAVDYITYFLLLAAIVAASQGRPDAESYQLAAAVALAGSIVVIAVAGYLRQRVASADPGQFDEASAQALASATWFHKFARWGRQWIKRSTIAHLVVVLALIDQVPVLLYLWAFGAVLASIVILVVEPFVVRNVAVAAAGVRDARGDA